MGRLLRFFSYGALAALLLAPGCRRTFSGEASQPNPLTQPGFSERASVPIMIVTGDLELSVPPNSDGSAGTLWTTNKRYPLRNVAAFTVVSRDRLRFHVQIEHKWEDYADIENWRAVLIDDRGRTYKPEEIDTREQGHISKMWDYEQRSVVRNRFQDIVFVNNDGFKRRVPLASLTVFRGRGDYVFYAHDIFTPDVKSIRLLLVRRATAFEFTWIFDEDGKIHGSGRTAPVAVQ